MKALAIHRYKITVKTSEKATPVVFNELSAVHPLENDRVKKRILKNAKFKNIEIDKLIVKIEKGDYLGMSNKIH